MERVGDMSAAHTPGPWYLDWDMTRINVHAEGVQIAIVRRSTKDGTASPIYDDAEARANARLIAAAPELLAACKAQHQAIDLLLARLIELDSTFLPSESPAWAAVTSGHAAAAKATGKFA